MNDESWLGGRKGDRWSELGRDGTKEGTNQSENVSSRGTRATSNVSSEQGETHTQGLQLTAVEVNTVLDIHLAWSH